MKVTEAKKSNSAQNRIQAKREPFFLKEGKGTFFSKSNKATTSFFSPTGIQPKLTIGQPNDKYEIEADTMADKVVQRLSDPSSVEPTSNVVQTKCATCDQEEKLQKKEEEISDKGVELQRKPIFESNAEQPIDTDIQAKLLNTHLPSVATNKKSIVQTKCAACNEKEKLQKKEEDVEADEEIQTKMNTSDMDSPPEEVEGIQAKSEGIQKGSTPDLQGQLNSSKGGGNSLSADVQSSMGSAFGADFSNVRIHTGGEAVQMNKELGAQAFTHGSDIYFNEGKYDANSNSGKHLLAHELTHTIQQGKSVQTKKQDNTSKNQYTKNGSPNIQRAWYNFDIPFTDYQFDPSIRGLKNAANITKDTAIAGGRYVYNKGKQFIIAQLERFAPGLLEFLRGDWVGIIKGKIGSAIDKLFNGLISKTQSGGLIAIIGAFVGQIAGNVFESSANLAAKTQAAVQKTSMAVFKFVNSLTKPLFRAFQRVSGRFISILDGIWSKLALPAFKAVKGIGGGIWSSLKSKASWAWNLISKVKNTLSDAWDWIRDTFNISWNGLDSVWSWLKDKIKAAWDIVYQFIQPIINPLKTLSSVFRIFSSGGPLSGLWSAGMTFWKYALMLINLVNIPKLFIQASQFLKNAVLPVLISATNRLKAFIKAGFSWLVSIFTSISSAFTSLIGTLNGIILSVIRVIVKAIAFVFDLIKSMVVSLIGFIVDAVNSLLTDFWGTLKTLFIFVTGIVLIILNPTNWFIFFPALAVKLVWTLIPDFIKPAATSFLIRMAIKAVGFLPAPPFLGSLWEVVKSGLIGFLNRIKAMGPDTQVKFIDKLINTAINPSYYTGFHLGVIKGIVWDGLVGLIKSFIDIFTMIPDLISGIYNFFKSVLEDVASIKKFIRSLGKLGKEVQKFINDPKALDQIVALIKKTPRILMSMVDKAFEVAKDWAKGAGEKVADSLFSFVLNNDAFNIGLKVGTVVGMILFELLLLFGTGAIGNAIKWGGKAISWIGKGLKMLVKGLKAGKGFIMRGFNAIKTVAAAGWKVLKGAVKGTLAKVFNRLKKLMNDIIAWFTKVFKRAFGKKKPPRRPRRRGRPPSAAELAAYNEFKTRLLTALQPYRVYGISKHKLRQLIRRARRPRRIKQVVRMTKISHGRSGRNNGKYIVRAIVDFAPGIKKVGKINRLPTGESRKEAISIHWHKRGYRQSITTQAALMDLSEWNPSIAPAPAATAKTFSINGGWIEVPSRRYRSFLGARTETVPRGGASVAIRKVRIGVARGLMPSVGKKMKRVRSAGASRSTQAKFRDKLLAPHGYNWSGMEADHVQDLGWGGSRLDILPNLWPLSDSANNAGNATYRQEVQYQIRRTGKKGNEKPMKLFNKWFKIRSFS